jgi:hypothetical protein
MTAICMGLEARISELELKVLDIDSIKNLGEKKKMAKEETILTRLASLQQKYSRLETMSFKSMIKKCNFRLICLPFSC